ncbi:17791_t:CDS:2, partial [Gigaspora rosea]
HWSKLKVLKKDDIKELSSDALSMHMRELAYHQYQTPLYALAAIHLQIQNSHNVTQQELNEIKEIFDKVNGKKEESKREEEDLPLNSNTEINSEINSEIKLESDFNNTMALVKIKDQKISFYHKRIIQNSISNDLTNMATKLFVEANRNFVRGVGVEGSSVLVGLANIYEATSMFGIPTLLIVGGAAFISFGVWCGL